LKEKHPKGISSLRSGHNQKFKPVKNQLNNLDFVNGKGKETENLSQKKAYIVWF
jgi:hypothetical protein